MQNLLYKLGNKVRNQDGAFFSRNIRGAAERNASSRNSWLVTSRG